MYLPPVVVITLWLRRTHTGSEPQAATSIKRPGSTTVSQGNANQVQTLTLTLTGHTHRQKQEILSCQISHHSLKLKLAFNVITNTTNTVTANFTSTTNTKKSLLLPLPYDSSVTMVVVPDGVIFPALALTAVAVQPLSVEQSFVFAQSPDHAPSHTHLAEHTGTVHLH